MLSSCVAIKIFCIETVTRGLDDVSNNQLKCADVPGIGFSASKNNFSEIHISWPPTLDFLPVLLFPFGHTHVPGKKAID